MPPTPAVSQYVSGLDVSHYQSNIDWQQVATSGYVFAYIKCTEGAKYIDPSYQHNYRAAQAAGLYTGSYHFLDLTSDWDTQAQHFLYSSVARSEADPASPGLYLPPVLDVEELVQAADVLKWLQTVEQAVSCKPILYCDAVYAISLSAACPDLTSYPLWIAEYGRPDGPRIGPWSGWAFWQHTSGGKVSGINTPVDLDYFAGTVDGLAMLSTTVSTDSTSST